MSREAENICFSYLHPVMSWLLFSFSFFYQWFSWDSAQLRHGSWNRYKKNWHVCLQKSTFLRTQEGFYHKDPWKTRISITVDNIFNLDFGKKNFRSSTHTKKWYSVLKKNKRLRIPWIVLKLQYKISYRDVSICILFIPSQVLFSHSLYIFLCLFKSEDTNFGNYRNLESERNSKAISSNLVTDQWEKTLQLSEGEWARIGTKKNFQTLPIPCSCTLLAPCFGEPQRLNFKWVE